MCKKVCYPWMKKPASETHLTIAAFGRDARNSSQCNMQAKPPAEPPESIACDGFHDNVVVNY